MPRTAVAGNLQAAVQLRAGGEVWPYSATNFNPPRRRPSGKTVRVEELEQSCLQAAQSALGRNAF